jgi:plasmid stabilization system protein ParE
MAIIIEWSDEATKTFDDNINYLMKEWSEKEIINFINQTNFKLSNIESNPKIYKQSEKKRGVRKTNINKNITLFFKYFPSKKKVVLLSFWHNRQDPKKLRF